jgi:hypothetical protein
VISQLLQTLENIMSWDISIQHLPDSAVCIDDIPNDFQPSALGPRASVIASILKAIPDVDFSDPSWGILRRDAFSIEFNMGGEVICNGFMLHVRGGGDAAGLIDQLLKNLGLRGLDCQTGDFFKTDTTDASFSDWQQFRDKVVSTSSSGDDYQ